MNDTMNIYAKNGHKVTVTEESARNGYDSDSIKVQDMIGKQFTVNFTTVHQSSTDVYLNEYPGIRFNSVNFEDVEPPVLGFTPYETKYKVVKRIDDHQCRYSRSMNQTYPRKCLDCGKVEETVIKVTATGTEEIKSKDSSTNVIELFIRYFMTCDQLNHTILNKRQELELHGILQQLEGQCIANLDVLIALTKTVK